MSDELVSFVQKVAECVYRDSQHTGVCIVPGLDGKVDGKVDGNTRQNAVKLTELIREHDPIASTFIVDLKSVRFLKTHPDGCMCDNSPDEYKCEVCSLLVVMGQKYKRRYVTRRRHSLWIVLVIFGESSKKSDKWWFRADGAYLKDMNRVGISINGRPFIKPHTPPVECKNLKPRYLYNFVSDLSRLCVDDKLGQFPDIQWKGELYTVCETLFGMRNDGFLFPTVIVALLMSYLPPDLNSNVMKCFF